MDASSSETSPATSRNLMIDTSSCGAASEAAADGVTMHRDDSASSISAVSMSCNSGHMVAAAGGGGGGGAAADVAPMVDVSNALLTSELCDAPPSPLRRRQYSGSDTPSAPGNSGGVEKEEDPHSASATATATATASSTRGVGAHSAGEISGERRSSCGSPVLESQSSRSSRGGRRDSQPSPQLHSDQPLPSALLVAQASLLPPPPSDGRGGAASPAESERSESGRSSTPKSPRGALLEQEHRSRRVIECEHEQLLRTLRPVLLQSRPDVVARAGGGGGGARGTDSATDSCSIAGSGTTCGGGAATTGLCSSSLTAESLTAINTATTSQQTSAFVEGENVRSSTSLVAAPGRSASQAVAAAATEAGGGGGGASSAEVSAAFTSGRLRQGSRAGAASGVSPTSPFGGTGSDATRSSAAPQTPLFDSTEARRQMEQIQQHFRRLRSIADRNWRRIFPEGIAGTALTPDDCLLLLELMISLPHLTDGDLEDMYFIAFPGVCFTRDTTPQIYLPHYHAYMAGKAMAALAAFQQQQQMGLIDWEEALALHFYHRERTEALLFEMRMALQYFEHAARAALEYRKRTWAAVGVPDHGTRVIDTLHASLRRVEARLHTVFEDPDNTITVAYQRGEVLSRGAFGTVYRCVNVNNGQFLALKELPLVDERSEQEIRVEIETLKSLNHKNVVKYFGCRIDRAAQVVSVLMEFAPRSLKEVVQASRGLARQLVALYARQILEGLKYIHAHHILHADIKTANVLVTDVGECKLSDFGSAMLKAQCERVGGHHHPSRCHTRSQSECATRLLSPNSPLIGAATPGRWGGGSGQGGGSAFGASAPNSSGSDVGFTPPEDICGSQADNPLAVLPFVGVGDDINAEDLEATLATSLVSVARPGGGGGRGAAAGKKAQAPSMETGHLSDGNRGMQQQPHQQEPQPPTLDMSTARNDPLDAAVAPPPAALEHAHRRNIVVCTPLFAAPEILRGQMPSEASDIWSFGCLLHELVSGRPPWQDVIERERAVAGGGKLSLEAVMLAIGSARRPPQLPVGLDLDPDFIALYDAAMQLDPAKRPSAERLLEHPFLCGGSGAAGGVMPGSATGTATSTSTAFGTPASALLQSHPSFAAAVTGGAAGGAAVGSGGGGGASATGGSSSLDRMGGGHHTGKGEVLAPAQEQEQRELERLATAEMLAPASCPISQSGSLTFTAASTATNSTAVAAAGAGALQAGGGSPTMGQQQRGGHRSDLDDSLKTETILLPKPTIPRP